MKTVTKLVYFAVIILFMSSFFIGCGGPRFSIVTATNMGLNINSGDGSTRPPQVSVAYKRAELAIVPTNRKLAEKSVKSTGAYSSLAGYHFDTRWFGPTSISQFISTGHASREILTGDFINALKNPGTNAGTGAGAGGGTGGGIDDGT